jgi:hypothetical protein
VGGDGAPAKGPSGDRDTRPSNDDGAGVPATDGVVDVTRAVDTRSGAMPSDGALLMNSGTDMPRALASRRVVMGDSGFVTPFSDDSQDLDTRTGDGSGTWDATAPTGDGLHARAHTQYVRQR